MSTVAKPTQKAAGKHRAHDHPTAPSVLSTLNDDGSRKWIKPRVSPGRFLKARRITAYGLIALFAVLPYLKLYGKPLVLLDVAVRRFTIFGFTFHPTDTLLLALAVVSIFVTVFLVTALFGRVWCGWACPQTVYMEFVYRPIERFFEGSPGRPKKGPLQTSPVGKFLKYPAFLVVSALIAHIFLSYFVGVDRLWDWMHRSPLQHPEGFIIVAVVTALMMFDFAFFREQACIVACPYGRFQSVMLDKDSLIVSYDDRRGEPRGARKAGADVSLKVVPGGVPSGTAAASAGDCVDCGMCVTTCPTGIDIRNGLQMECIGCAQCIDACDTVMTKLKRPRGLIRYTSLAAVRGTKTHFMRVRTVLYPVLLCVVLTIFVIVLSTKGHADVTVLRGLGTTFTALDTGEISNRVRVKIVNRTDQPRTYTIRATGIEGIRLVAEDNPVTLAPGESKTIPATVDAPYAGFTFGKAQSHLVVTDDQGYEVTKPYRLLGPGNAGAIPKPKHDEDDDKDERDGHHEGSGPADDAGQGREPGR
jgi:cytochrome c oxidase accessory protein FixG